MPEIIALSAQPREHTGRGAARAVRRLGRVPAIVYGGKSEPRLISLEPHELQRALARPGFLATLVDVTIDGAAERTVPREVQYHPTTDMALHIDFMRVTPGSRVTVTVPVAFINHDQSPGIRRGGILNIVRHGVELNTAVESIPDRLVVDLAGLEIGDSVHISAVTLPEGARPMIAERDFTIATIAASSAVREEAAAAAAAPPPEPTAEGEEQPEAAPPAAEAQQRTPPS